MVVSSLPVFPAHWTINWSFFSAPHPIVFWNKFYLLSPSQQALSQVTFVLILRSGFVLLYLNHTAAPQIHLEWLLGEQGMLIGLRTSRGIDVQSLGDPRTVAGVQSGIWRFTLAMRMY